MHASHRSSALLLIASVIHTRRRIEKYKTLFDLVSSSDKKVEWAKMGCEEDGFCYDEIKLGSDPIHPFRAGEESFIEDRPPCACQSDHAIEADDPAAELPEAIAPVVDLDTPGAGQQRPVPAAKQKVR